MACFRYKCINMCKHFFCFVIFRGVVYQNRIRRDRLYLGNALPQQFDSLSKQIDSHHWLKWIHDQTRNPKLSPPSRNEAIAEFDYIYFLDNNWLVVNKFKDYAPFIGLLLTAFSSFLFYFYDLAGIEKLSLAELIQRVLPLLNGVAFGALLTLGISGLAHYINLKINEYRQDALNWFDAASRHARNTLAEDIQTQITAQITATNTTIVEQMALFLAGALAKTQQVDLESKNLRDSALTSAKAAEIACISAAQASQSLDLKIVSICQNIGPSIDLLVNSLSSTSAQFKDFSTNHAKELQSISNTSVDLGRLWLNLQSEIKQIAGGSAELVEVTKSFRQAVGPAAEVIQTASNKYASLTTSLSESATTVNQATGIFQNAINLHTDGLRAVNDSIQKSLLPSSLALTSTAKKLEKNAQQLDGHTQQMGVNLENAINGLKKFDSIGELLEISINSKFLPLIATLGDLPHAIKTLCDESNGAATMLQNATVGLNQITEENQKAIKTAISSFENIQSMINISASIVSSINNSAVAFAEAVEEIKHTSKSLSKINEGLEGIPKNLNDFKDVLEGLSSLSHSIFAIGDRLQKFDEVASGKGKEQFDNLSSKLDAIQAKIDELIKADGNWIWGPFFRR